MPFVWLLMVGLIDNADNVDIVFILGLLYM